MRIFIVFTLLIIMDSTRAQTITIHIHHFVGARPLQLFNETYLDPFGEPFTIQRFRYYITASDQSFLVDESDSASKIILWAWILATALVRIASLSVRRIMAFVVCSAPITFS